MPCKAPLQGFFHYYSDGSRKIVFSTALTRIKYEGNRDSAQMRAYCASMGKEYVQTGCGQCTFCRLEHSRHWAIRCVNEASLYARNSYITCTYAPKFLPENSSLVKKDFQDFMKRLRFKFGEGIRSYHCGEYGEKLGRPHYHACLFNLDFDDKKFFKKVNGFKIYTSEDLTRIWGKGHCSVGSVSFASAAYVARYIMKKVKGSAAEFHYLGKLPEYTDQSRRPGIGREWILKNLNDVYPSDYLIINGRKVKPPRYYDNVLEQVDPVLFQRVKQARIDKALSNEDPDDAPDRLHVKDVIQIEKFRKLVRNLEKELV